MGAAADDNRGHEEEASPLLAPPPADENEKQPLPAQYPSKGCADGVPVVMGEPVAAPPRESWDTGLLSCLGRNDEFCSSDVEVCLLGSVAPCVLYGSNVERLAAVPGTFANSCLPYTGLYMLGNSLFGWNCLAPWFSHPTRTAIRRTYNLEGNFEAFTKQCGCCRGLADDEEMREHLEVACDLATLPLSPLCPLPGGTRAASQGPPPRLQWAVCVRHDATHGADYGACDVNCSSYYPALAALVCAFMFCCIRLFAFCSVNTE